MDPEEIDLDDLVFSDDLDESVPDAQDVAQEVMDMMDSDGGDGDEGGDEDAPWIEPDDARDIADETFLDRLHHLAFEDCETDECQQIRDQFGIDPDGEASPEGDESGDGEEAEQGPDHDGDDDDGGNDADENPGESESSDGSSDDDEAETNVFGEPV